MDTVKAVKDWAVLPYNSKKISGHFLVSNLLGCWDVLDPQEFRALEQFSLDEASPLFDRLYDKGLIVKEDNVSRMIAEFRSLHSHLFTDASLHIVVLTTRCNIACRYCQARVDDPRDMTLDVAAQVVTTALNRRNPNINLEFQGGEPLLNWDVMKSLIESVRGSNIPNKNVAINLVTNGLLLDDQKTEFLLDHHVGICISLDGPEAVHNTNRVFGNGQGTYHDVKEAVQRLKKARESRGRNDEAYLLPTLSQDSLKSAKEIIDEYVEWGVASVALRPMNKIGGARCHWDQIGYDPEEFNRFWAEAVDYMLDLNRRGINIKERMASVMLMKILRKRNPGFVDLMSPCGAGRSVMTYMPNGDIYPCDEARMASRDMFRLGNVLEDSYEDIIKSPKFFSIFKSSLMDFWDYNSAFSPWMGTCPVLNFLSQGNLVPRITQTPMYKIYRFQFEYLFKKMIEDPDTREIFDQWAV